MKRSESVLVYAVTAILAVILVVAVVFGNEGEAASLDGPPKLVAGDPAGLGGRLDGVGQAEMGQGEKGRGDASADPSVVVGAPQPRGDADGPKGEPQFGGPVGPVLRAASPSVAELLGSFAAENQMDGVRYRLVPVQRGDTFSELIAKWTADPGCAPQVLAMNEWLQDPKQLPAGETLRLPWVDDAVLVEAFRRRQDSAPRATPVARAAGATPPAAGVTPPAASVTPPAASETYTVAKGDSLWGIAERRVGARSANVYIDALKRLNPAINADGAIKAGQRLVLPPVE